MVMEAMRLSLLEHEAQQRRLQEEEAKKRREEEATAASAGGAGGALGNSVAGSAESTTPSQPASDQPTSPSLQPRADSVETPTPSLPPISPSPAPSDLLSPASDTSVSQPSGRSTPSSQHDATNAAGPDAFPAVEFEITQREASDITVQAEPVSAPPTDSHSRQQTPLSSSVIADNTSVSHSEPNSSSEQTPDLPPALPRLSFSSLAQSNYDVLPSSPESTISSKPLIERVASTTGPGPAPEGNSSAAAS
ncbi:hypothetical protein BN946_scf184798.g40 [Trametes cinnabarina]|uniref:Uncharacterized protein n=1 Tax=Pycnoporus cinnabarinus TaxID=5643 RepID=A0A060S8P4_PYCCI|nr:hypothetical protein BN946_scf184798.g40 [Trametes cinnabarina]